jgi:hypothetical protein
VRVQDAVHLDGSVEVALAIEDGGPHVSAAGQELLEPGRGLDGDALVSGVSQLVPNGDELGTRQSYGYGGPRHDCESLPATAEARNRV